MKLSSILFLVLVLSLTFIPGAHAGKVELTTYYPAPFGEYKELNSTGDTHLATSEDAMVGVGTSTPRNKLDVKGAAVIGATYPEDTEAPADGLLVGGYVGIGTAAPKAVLDVDSTTSAFLPPRMTTAQRDHIKPLFEGMVIYNTDNDRLEVNTDGTKAGWRSALGGGGVPITGDGTLMNLSSLRAKYTVLCWYAYFTCQDYPTTLKLSMGSGVVGQKIYKGFNADSQGCDQNTIMVKLENVPGGRYTWSAESDSTTKAQEQFLWMAYQE